MISSSRRPGLLAATALLLGLLCADAPAAVAPDILTADVPAAGLSGLTFKAGAGEVKITASADDAIHAKLELEQDQRSFLLFFHWMSGATTRDLAAAKLQVDKQSGQATLSLAYPGGVSHSDVKQKWVIAMPARLALTAEMQAGLLKVDGLTAGVSARLDYGDLEIHALKGPIQASITGGRLFVVSDDTQPGAMRLASTFGLAALSLNGKYFGPPLQHGFMNSFHLFGNSVAQQGPGKADIDLKTTAGLVVLRIGPLGDDKQYQGLFTE